MLLRLFFLSLSLSWIIGCSTYKGLAIVRRVDIPLQALQQEVAKALPGGPSEVLEKGRLFISKPFIIENGQPVVTRDSGRRYYVKIWLRGSRPYTIDIKAIEEKVLGSKRQVLGSSDWVAKGMERLIRTRLTKRRKEMNLIDDFRPF